MPAEGLIRGEALQDYHTCDAISHSKLKFFKENFPSDYFAKYIAKTTPEEERKAHFDFGNAVEARCIGADEYKNAIAICPYPDYRTNAARAWKKEKIAEGKIILTADDDLLAVRCFESVMRNRDARAIIEQATPQVTFRAKVGGVCLQARSDFWAHDGVILPSDGTSTGPLDCDLKTTECLQKFEKQAVELGYDHAAVFYRSVIQLTLARIAGVSEDSLPFVRRLFIAVDKRPNPSCTVFTMTDELLTVAENEVMGAAEEPGLLPRLISHYMRNEWPGAPERGEIKAPYWKRKKPNV